MGSFDCPKVRQGRSRVARWQGAVASPGAFAGWWLFLIDVSGAGTCVQSRVSKQAGQLGVGRALS